MTAVRKPRLSGQATPGILVQIYNQSQQLVASALADASGNYVATLNAALAPGQYSFAAVAIDQFGNYSAVAARLSVTITPPPAAPAGLSLFPADANRGPNSTTLTQPRIAGSATAGLLVQVFESTGVFVGSAFADVSGNFVFAPASRLALGTHILRAVAIDAGGNYGALSATFTFSVVA